MNKSMLSLFLILLLISPMLCGAEQMELSSWFATKEDRSPQVVTNESNNEWLVAWGQAQKIKGCIVKPNGELGSMKTLAKAAGNSKSLSSLAYNPIDQTYLVLYFNSQSQLASKLLSATLGRKGGAHTISDDTISTAQLVFDPVAKTYSVFWIEIKKPYDFTAHTTIKTCILDATGKAISTPETVLDGKNRIHYRDLRVARNPGNGNLFLSVSQISISDYVISIVGYTLKSEGTLLHDDPITFASKRSEGPYPAYVSYFSIPEAQFDDNGTGMSTWAAKDMFCAQPCQTQVHARQLTGRVKFGHRPRVLAKVPDGALENSIVLNPAQDEFLVLWQSQSVDGAIVDPNTGAVLDGPFRFGEPSYFSGISTLAAGVDAAYEKTSGKTLIVWMKTCENNGMDICPGSSNSASQVNAVIFNNKGTLDLNGTWNGKTGEGKNFDFEVVNDKILTFDFEWVVGTCTGMEAVRFVTGAPISDDKFSTLFLGEGAVITINGTFTSETTAKGSLYVEGSDCGFGQNTWTAVKK